MTKMYLVLVVVALVSLLLIGCQFIAVETKSVQETAKVESSTPSAEEVEVSQGLEALNDLDQLEKEINELEGEELGNTTQ